MERIRKHFARDRYATRTSGIELIEVEPGRARARMVIKDQHLNAINTVQGGAIFTLADYAFALASNSYGTIAVAANVNITFLKAVTGGTLVAEAEEVSISRRLGTYLVRVTDDAGDVVALFQGLAYRKKDPHPA